MEQRFAFRFQREPPLSLSNPDELCTCFKEDCQRARQAAERAGIPLARILVHTSTGEITLQFKQLTDTFEAARTGRAMGNAMPGEANPRTYFYSLRTD